MPRPTRSTSKEPRASGRKPIAAPELETHSAIVEEALEALDDLVRILARQAARRYLDEGEA